MIQVLRTLPKEIKQNPVFQLLELAREGGFREVRMIMQTYPHCVHQLILLIRIKIRED